MDPVTAYLKLHGMDTSHEYFENSSFVIGRKLEQEKWSLVYRFEDSTLVICDFKSHSQPDGLKSAVSSFVTLLRKIRKNIPEVHKIKGMIIEDTGTFELRQARAALRNILLKNGAKIETISGESWLIY